MDPSGTGSQGGNSSSVIAAAGSAGHTCKVEARGGVIANIGSCVKSRRHDVGMRPTRNGINGA